MEHLWPRDDGIDPYPQRCPVVLDSELDDHRWTKYSTLRCPWEKASGSDRCAHHDPRPDELCGYPMGTGAPCLIPEIVFPCAQHMRQKEAELERATHEVASQTLCPQCSAGAGQPCRTKSGRQCGFHKQRGTVIEGSRQVLEIAAQIRRQTAPTP
ncbi:hypothetical protein [Streptomyces sp. NPDC048442]|uniref:hypothetical protein n=1 Tax=Streptomyces sp. NPDC048442 TaxID=3154823 RepID=UPI0034350A59